MTESWSTSYLEHDNEIHFIIRWSPWGLMNKWTINRIIPSEAGVFQLWVKNGRGIVLLVTETTYYNGLRNSLREVVDEMVPSGRRLQGLIAQRETWFRFSTIITKKPLQMLERWFTHSYPTYDENNRKILIREVETLKRFSLPPQEIECIERNQMKIADFGPQLPKNS